MPSLKYTGTELLWIEKGSVTSRFPATSGMTDFQAPSEQCTPDSGPIPEGTYWLHLFEDPNVHARIADSVSCELVISGYIQHIPLPTESTARCGPYWENWGIHRVRIEPYDRKAKTACRGRRSGFYIHDSSKGFTHGCIEVSQDFFKKLFDFVNSHPEEKTMLLLVDYRFTKTTRRLTQK